MKNIVNIIKFDIINKKVQLIIEAAVILFFTIQLSTFWSWIPSEYTFIPVISVILLISLISTIVKFMKSISSEEGRLLFLAPIKGWEFLFAKYIGFTIEGITIVVLTIIGAAISGGELGMLAVTSISILWAFLILLIFITTLSIIYKSYFNSTGICIILTVITMVVVSGVISILELICYIALPSVYLIIGDFLEINLFNSFVYIVIFVGLIYMSINHIDKKLDII